MPRSQDVIIVWFRHDLRLADHAALTAAVNAGARIVPLYVLDDENPREWQAGGASRWWLHKSLESLSADLTRCGVQLILRRGNAEEVVCSLARETRAKAIYCSRSYEPWACTVEASIRKKLLADGVAFKRFPGTLLHEPDQLVTTSGGPYKVYTPFWRALRERISIRQPTLAPDRIPPLDRPILSEKLSCWHLLPTKPDWASGLRQTWHPGEKAASQRMDAFISAALPIYAEGRNRPDREFTSRLSPYLHFGEISPRQCWHRALAASHAKRKITSGLEQSLETFLKELVWREFSYHLLFHFPDLPQKPFRPEFSSFPWVENERALAAWQRGMTGFPIVDAGMRELWHTGWMHNRVRMVVASFLVKDLLIPWQKGQAWFWDTLVDADLASNSASWQWVSGSGADAAPYFRIFNPVKQGEKFDFEGAYVRRWVPELARLPTSWIHKPWAAPAEVLIAAGVELGKDYPEPIVDHSVQRDRALEAYAEIKPKRLAG